MKKWILILLILVCNVGFAVTPQEYFTFATDTFMITGYNSAGGSDVVVPATFTVDMVDYSVERIGNDAFMNKGITSVVLPESLLVIESGNTITSGAFMGNGLLTSITIPNSVTYIGDSAFRECGLNNVTLSESLVGIGVRAFSNNEISSITFPLGLETIYDYAFEYNNFTAVTIPDSVTLLRPRAFLYNNQLTKIELGTGFSWVEIYVFGSSPIVDITLNRSMSYGSLNVWGDHDSSFKTFYSGIGKPNGRFVYDTVTASWSVYTGNNFTDIIFKIPFGGQTKLYSTLANKEDVTGILFASKVGTQTIYIDSEVDTGGVGMKFYMNGQTMRFLNEVQ